MKYRTSKLLALTLSGALLLSACSGGSGDSGTNADGKQRLVG